MFKSGAAGRNVQTYITKVNCQINQTDQRERGQVKEGIYITTHTAIQVQIYVNIPTQYISW